jgi:DNA-directed RNA polymerase subunit RPC12/RpoP
MYKCNKCNKEFPSPSKLNKHKTRKNPCDKIKEELKCQYCNVSFTRPAEKLRHEKTNKHINNYNNCNVQNNVNGNNIQNIINLTLLTKPFNSSDFSDLKKYLIEDVGEDFIKLKDNNSIHINEKIKRLFKGALKILESLHFNLNNENNHNCKILLMFPGFKNPMYEYLILEIEPETNKITWNSLTFEQFLKELLEHFSRMNEIVNNENFDRYIYYLQSNLLINDEIRNDIKEYLEIELSNLYINFNAKQKKITRPIKVTIEEKIDEYKQYRNDECRLHNGYSPIIENSIIN